jgi:hypothetical protein
MPRPIGQPHLLEEVHGALLPLLPGHPLVIQRQGDVVQRILEPNQVKTLEHKTQETAPVARCLPLAQALHVDAPKGVTACIEPIQQPEDIEQRGLPRS